MWIHLACFVLGTFCYAPSHISASFLLWYLEMSKSWFKAFVCVQAGAVPAPYPVTILSSSAVRTAEGCDDDQGRLQRSCGSSPTFFLFLWLKGSSDIRYLHLSEDVLASVNGAWYWFGFIKRRCFVESSTPVSQKLSEKLCKTQGLLQLFFLLQLGTCGNLY